MIEKPHKHDFFAFLLFEKGNGVHSIDFVDYPVKANQVHFLFPNQVHKWDLGKNTLGYQLMISRPVFEVLSGSLEFSFVLYRNHPVIDLSPGVFKKLLYEFLAIRNELTARPIHWGIINLRSRLITQLVSREVERKFEDMIVYRTKPVLLKYHALVDAHFREQKSVAFYATNLHLSANYLNILCKRHLHVPALYLVQNRVILEAKRLILASEMSIKEIAFELGFTDLAYFSNFFKNQTGVSPRSFKEQ